MPRCAAVLIVSLLAPPMGLVGLVAVLAADRGVAIGWPAILLGGLFYTTLLWMPVTAVAFLADWLVQLLSKRRGNGLFYSIGLGAIVGTVFAVFLNVAIFSWDTWLSIVAVIFFECIGASLGALYHWLTRSHGVQVMQSSEQA